MNPTPSLSRMLYGVTHDNNFLHRYDLHRHLTESICNRCYAKIAASSDPKSVELHERQHDCPMKEAPQRNS